MSRKNRGLNDREIVPTFPLNSMDSSRRRALFSYRSSWNWRGITSSICYTFRGHRELFVEIPRYLPPEQSGIKARCVRGYLWNSESVYRTRAKVRQAMGATRHAFARPESKQLIEENANFRGNFIERLVLRINLVSHMADASSTLSITTGVCDLACARYSGAEQRDASSGRVEPMIKSVRAVSLDDTKSIVTRARTPPSFTADQPSTHPLTVSPSHSLFHPRLVAPTGPSSGPIRTFAAACSGHPAIIRSVGRP